MAFTRNLFSVLALIFTVAVPYHARDSHYTIVQLANSQTRILANSQTRSLPSPVNHLGLSMPWESVVRLTDRLDMTIVVDWEKTIHCICLIIE